MYVLRDADEGNCGKGHPLKLLASLDLPDGYPAFLVCFLCQEVTEVDGDDGQVVQYKGGKRKKFLRPTKKEERLREERSLRKSARRNRRHGRQQRAP